MLSCKNGSPKAIEEKKDNKTTEKHFHKTRTFQKEYNLFLSFYKGMNKKEFIDNGINKVKARNLFTAIENYKSKYRLINKFDFNDKLIDSTELDNSFFLLSKSFYYPFRTPEHTFFAVINPEYHDNSLISITLSGPKFIGEYNPKHNSELKNKESQNFKNNILELYTSKYGSPEITREKYDDRYDTLYFTLNGINKNDCDGYRYTYTFLEKSKTIEITVNCNGKISTEIKYILTSDYIKQKKLLQEKKINEIKMLKKEKEQTLEEI